MATSQGLSKRRRAGVGADPKLGGLGPRKAAAARVRAHFNSLAPKERHSFVKKSLGKGWQKRVYGDDYKYGTVKKLNKNLSSEREALKKKVGNVQAARENLKKSSGSKYDAIQSRLKTLQEEKNSAAQQIKGSKSERQKFLNLRNKALETTAGKVINDESIMSSTRKGAVKEALTGGKDAEKGRHLKMAIGNKGIAKTSEAQNAPKPRKVNTGPQVPAEWGKKPMQVKIAEATITPRRFAEPTRKHQAVKKLRNRKGVVPK